MMLVHVTGDDGTECISLINSYYALMAGKLKMVICTRHLPRMGVLNLPNEKYNWKQNKKTEVCEHMYKDGVFHGCMA